jgi:hypothetical protein
MSVAEPVSGTEYHPYPELSRSFCHLRESFVQLVPAEVGEACEVRPGELAGGDREQGHPLMMLIAPSLAPRILTAV